MLYSARGGVHKIRKVDRAKNDFTKLGRLIDKDTGNQLASLEAQPPLASQPEGGVAPDEEIE